MGSRLVFVGTYTDPERQAGREVSPEAPLMGMTGPTGSTGIYVYRQHAETDTLSLLHSASGIVNPSFLIVDSAGKHLYAVNETRDHEGEESGAVSSFRIDSSTGTLDLVNQVPTGGGNPCHLTLSPCERYLLVANHEHASVAVFPVTEAGELAPATHLVQDKPVAPKSDRRPHAHFVTFEPSGNYVLSSDTGTDRISVYSLDMQSGRLKANDPPFGETHEYGSPRHLTFHPSGRFLFTNGEADMSLSVFQYDSSRGSLSYLHHVSTLPDGATGRFSTAQIMAHGSGDYVYVSNRGHDSIAVFRVDQSSGLAELVEAKSTGGSTPRNFTIDPSGTRLYVANQNSNSVVCFRICQQTGRLLDTDILVDVPAPTCIAFFPNT